MILNMLAILLLSGCSTVRTAQVSETPQVIGVSEELTVHLYNSVDELRAAYMYQGGDIRKKDRVIGFYTEGVNTIHCLKWDFYTCGHELHHALQFNGAPTLLVDKGYEHFEGKNYTLIDERDLIKKSYSR